MNAIATISDDIYAMRDNFNILASDRGVNFDKEAGFAIQLLSGSDFAMKAAMNNRQAVCDAITNIAAIGISLNPAKKQAYLVPRKNKICLDISYIGLIDLAVDSGSIMWAQANVVREHDSFIINGFDKPPTHGHDPFAGAQARGSIKGAYVVVKTCDGEYLTHTMDIAAIYSVRDRSEAWKAGNSGPWKTDEGEMIKKTVVKQAYKYWPKTDRTERLDEAIHHLNTEGEGFSAINNQPATFAPEELAAWVAKAREAKTEAALATVWSEGLAQIKPSKDLSAYNRFKDSVVARGEALKQSAPVDVVDKNQERADPAPTFAAVMEKMIKTKKIDDLDAAADLIKTVADDSHRAELSQKYDDLRVALIK